MIDAATALNLGLVNKVVPVEKLMDEAMAWAFLVVSPSGSRVHERISRPATDATITYPPLTEQLRRWFQTHSTYLFSWIERAGSPYVRSALTRSCGMPSRPKKPPEGYRVPDRTTTAEMK